MVEYGGEMDAVFHALSHPTRRDMLARLRVADLTVGQLAEPLPVSLAAASKHIGVLEQAGLVRRTVDGRTHVCRLAPAALAPAAAWLQDYESYWTMRFDALEQALLDGANLNSSHPSDPSDPRTLTHQED